jgi:hypothetical protein
MAEACAKINIKVARDVSLTQRRPVAASQLALKPALIESVERVARKLWGLRVPFSWDMLEQLGLPPSTAQRLRPALEVRKPSVVVRELALAEPEQYAAVALFFDMMMRYRRRTVLCLDAGVTRRQLCAALLLRELPARGQPTGVVGSVLCCDRVLTITAQVGPGYRGTNNVRVSLDTGQMSCRPRGTRPPATDSCSKRTYKAADHAIAAYDRLQRSAMPMDPAGVALRVEALEELHGAARKQAKAHGNVVCKTLLHLPCGREPLLVPVVGFVTSVLSTSGRTDTLTMCPRCCRMTEFSPAMHGPNGFTCGACDAAVREAALAPVAAGEPRCYFCGATQSAAAKRAQELSIFSMFTGIVAQSECRGVQTIYMCSCCFSPWIYNTTQAATSEDIRLLWRAQGTQALRVDELCDSTHDRNALAALEHAAQTGSLPRPILYTHKALSFTTDAFSSQDLRDTKLPSKNAAELQKVRVREAALHRRHAAKRSVQPDRK